MNIKIYNGFHADCELIDTNIVKPLLLGADFNKSNIEGVAKDNTGDNISDKNKMYCELTGQYWMWKNVECDYIGFFHYRRQMIFNDNYDSKVSEWGLVNFDAYDNNVVEKLGLTDENIEAYVKDYDLILPKKWDVTNANSKNMYEHYEKSSQYLHIEDLEIATKILLEKYPEYKDVIENEHVATEGYFTNIFLMKKEIYNKYCEWLFDILEEAEKQIDATYYNQQEYRVTGYIAEWLCSVYFTNLQNINPELRVKHLNRTMMSFDNAPIKPLNVENAIPVVFAGDDAYVPYILVAIQSIMDNLDNKYYLDTIILSDKISRRSTLRINDYVKGFKNLSIRVKEINDYNDMTISLHMNKMTMYRFLIPDIMKEYGKIIYLDGDLVLNDDLSKMYNIDLQGKGLGAVPCLAFKAMYAKNIGADRHVYKGKIRDYMAKYIGINDKNCQKYFNAGVLIMDLNVFRNMKFKKNTDKYIESRNGRIWFNDQDILNYFFQEKYIELDRKWNTMTINFNHVKEYLPVANMEEYIKAFKNPSIVHYAGGIKPWLDCDAEYSEYFWKYARKTNVYEKLLKDMSVRQAGNVLNRGQKVNNYYKNKKNPKDKCVEFLYKGYAKFSEEDREKIKSMFGQGARNSVRRSLDKE